MAWGTSTGTVASQNSKAAGATYTSGAITCPIGDQIFLFIAFDNLDVATPTITGITTAATETAVWVQIAAGDSATSTAAAGIRAELWGITPTVTWTAFSPVVTLSGSVTAKASAGFCKSGGTLRAREALPLALTNSSGASPSVTTTVAPFNGDLVIGMADKQQPPATFTADADTVNGSWSAAIDSGTTGGTSNTNVNAFLQHKTVTADGDQTFNLTNALSTGHAGVIALVPATATTTARVSRVHGEALLEPTPDAQVSRVHGEVLVLPTPDAQVSRVHGEVLVAPTPDAQVSRVHVEVLVQMSPPFTGTWTVS